MASAIGHIELSAAPPVRAGRGRAAALGCALLVAIAVALNQSAVHWRTNVVDSHLFAWHGWCVSQGATPYVNIWDNKPPGIWWLNAAGFWLCGEGIGGELLICSIALATALAAFIGAAGIAYGRSMLVLAALTGCVLLPHPIYEGGANRTETFVLACEGLAVLAYLCWLHRRRWMWLLAAGLAAGAAPLFKQSGLAAGAAIGLHLVGTTLSDWRRQAQSERGVGRTRAIWCAPLALAAGFAVAPTAAAATLYSQGALAEAWYAIAAFNRAYFDIGDATYLRIDQALGVFKEVLLPLVWMFTAAALGLILAVAREATRRRSARSNAVLVTPPAPALQSRTYVELFWLWFVLAAYLACVGPGRRGHHFMPALAPLGLMALYPMHLLAGTAGLGRGIIARPSNAAVLVVYLYAIALLACGSAAEMGRCWQDKSHWYSLRYAVESGWEQQAAEIRQLARPDETIYVWGWSPGTYRYAYRRAASRYATFEKVGQLGRHAEFILRAAKRDLCDHPPRVLVISPADLRGLTNAAADEFGLWLSENYADRGVLGGMHVLSLRPATQPAPG